MTMEGDETFSVNSDFFEEADLLARTKPEKGWFGKEKIPMLTYSYYITSRERSCTVMDGDVVVQTDVKIPSRVSGVTVKHNEQGWTEAFVIKGKATKISSVMFNGAISKTINCCDLIVEKLRKEINIIVL